MIFEKILQWASEQQLLIRPGEDDIVFQVNGQSGSWISRAKAMEEDGMIFVLSAYPFAVPPEKRAEVALALNEISSNLKLGIFYLDEEDGQINFRLGQFLWPEEEEETDQRVRNIIMLAMGTTDNYYQKMLELAGEEEEE
jgi:hypothetical protein